MQPYAVYTVPIGRNSRENNLTITTENERHDTAVRVYAPSYVLWYARTSCLRPELLRSSNRETLLGKDMAAPDRAVEKCGGAHIRQRT